MEIRLAGFFCVMRSHKLRGVLALGDASQQTIFVESYLRAGFNCIFIHMCCQWQACTHVTNTLQNEQSVDTVPSLDVFASGDFVSCSQIRIIIGDTNPKWKGVPILSGIYRSG